MVWWVWVVGQTIGGSRGSWVKCIDPWSALLRSFCNFLVINYIFIITINVAYALVQLSVNIK